MRNLPLFRSLLVLVFVALLMVPALAAADIVPTDGPQRSPATGVVALLLAFGAAVLLHRPSARPRPAHPYRVAAEREAPPVASRVRHWAGAVVAVAALASLGANCSAAQVAADINAVANALPIACSVVSAVDGSSAGQVCGTVAGDVASVTALIQGLLSKLPALPAPSAAVAVAPPVVWQLGTTQVTLRPDFAAQIKTAAQQHAVALHH